MDATPGAESAAQQPQESGSAPRRGGSSTSRRSRGTTRSVGEKSFPTDEERYEWEIEQRFKAMDSRDRWVAADGVYTIGPPIPPSATVFHGESPTPTFKLATDEGYIAVRPACEILGISRRGMRSLIDKLMVLDVAYVVYPGVKKNSRYHCRMIHRKSVNVLKRDVRKWMKEANRNGKKTKAANIRRSG